MTLREFKFWLEGFLEATNNSPTYEQWQVVKKKLEDETKPNITCTSGLANPFNIGTVNLCQNTSKLDPKLLHTIS